MKLKLNPWLQHAQARASRVVEDSDRKALAEPPLHELVARVHSLACASAIDVPCPRLKRLDADGTVWLRVTWEDPKSLWSLAVSLVRIGRDKPYVVLEYGGEREYTLDLPTDAHVRHALWEYFESWKGKR